VSAKPVIRRVLARQDIEAAVDYYLTHAGERIALRFIDAVEHGCRSVSRSPAAGSPRYGQALDLPGLRFWPLRRFPYLIFYFERADHVDVWRVLHGSRDIPDWLQVDP
jgi:toxin ParE1/3/4